MTVRIDSTAFLGRIERMAADTPAGQRRIVAIAGAPGSGKSTLAAAAVSRALAAAPGSAALLPMDGFHLDDEVLVPRGWRPRKGAPHTFDTGGLRAALERLARNDEPWVAVPRFDRGIEIARAGAILIPADIRLIVAEGNWLLLDDPPWPLLAPHFDITVMLDVPEEVLAARLRDRWVGHGLSEAEIRARLDDNDLPNARLVIARSRPADWTVGG
jgi:pantothenate kinase